MINLSKGQRIDLSKDVESALNNLKIGLGWDAKPGAVAGADLDLDVSLLLLGSNNKPDMNEMDTNSNCDSFIYFKNPLGAKGKIKHSGDNRTGSGDGDDETIDVQLASLDAKYQKILILVTVATPNVTFGQVENAYVKMSDTDSNKELLRFDLDFDASTATGVTFASLTRRNDKWYFVAEQKEFAGGLTSMLETYGVSASGEGN